MRPLLPLGRRDKQEALLDEEYYEEEEYNREFEDVWSSEEELPAPTPSAPISVTFVSLNVAKLSISQIPEGWEVLKDDMALGEEPGSIVFEDNSVYGPQSVELDIKSYTRPIWSFRVIKGAKSKAAMGMRPVKEAYLSLQSFLAGGAISVKEWTDTQFSVWVFSSQSPHCLT